MLVYSIKGDISAIQRSLTSLQQQKVPTAAARALNKTIGNVQTQASKSIREERALSARVVRDALKIRRATKTNLVATLTASGRPIPLREYAARVGKRGVTVKVSPGPRKLVTHASNKAFAIDKFGGHIYARTSKRRLPIKKLFGPSIPATFLKEKVVAAIAKTGAESWPKRFAEELKFELSKG